MRLLSLGGPSDVTSKTCRRPTREGILRAQQERPPSGRSRRPVGVDVVTGNEPDHQETGRAWDVVAREKYIAEFDDHLALLRSGRDNLLPEEREVLMPLLVGAHVVHLQCSHGLDALGLLNAGAASVVGVDISPEMIGQARAKTDALGATRATFVVADAADPPPDLEGTADLVYTGRGALPWILDLEQWASATSRLLKPGGHLFIFEGHPLADLWDRTASDLRLRTDAGYFSGEPHEAPGFPADLVQRTLGPDRPRLRERHWPFGAVADALIQAGLRLLLVRELPTLFWDQFPYWPDDLRTRVPNSYAILAQRELTR